MTLTRFDQSVISSSFSLRFVVFLMVFMVAVAVPTIAQVSGERTAVDGSNGQWSVESAERARDVRIADFLGRQSLWLKNGTQVMRSGIEFVDGVIEFDMAPMDKGNFVGIIFRRVSFGNHENIYLRLHQSGRFNAVQYAPRINFSPTWQLYPEFNAVADFARNKWTHLRVEVRGTTLQVFISDQTKPILEVRRLRGTTQKGEVSFWARVNDKQEEWAAAVSNITIRQLEPSTMESTRSAPPTGTITSWELSGPVKSEKGVVTAIPEIKDWKPIEAEESGLVNINRAIVRPTVRSTAFARTTISAISSRTVLLQLGYSDEITVFLNSKPVYSGINGFESRHPEYLGFVKPDYENLFLELRRGNNELVLAVTDDLRFGWGFNARLKDLP